MSSDEACQRSASITEVVAVRGGGIPLEAPIGQAWIMEPDEVQGQKFVDIYTGGYMCKKYLDGNNGMIQHIKKNGMPKWRSSCGRSPLKMTPTIHTAAGQRDH